MECKIATLLYIIAIFCFISPATWEDNEVFDLKYKYDESFVYENFRNHAFRTNFYAERFLIPLIRQNLTVIWMHGLGDSADGFLDVFSKPDYSLDIGTIKYVLLNAPENPVTMNGGAKMRSWYDMKGLTGDPERDALSIDVNELEDSTESPKTPKPQNPFK
jgi:hypothetical protein